VALIDLGQITDAPPLPPARPLDRRRVLRPILAVLAVLGVGVLGGAARPAPSPVRLLWSIPADESSQVGFDNDAVYVSTASDARATVTAYEVATGRTRWSIPVGVQSPSWPAVAGDRLLLGTDPVTVDRKTADGTAAIEVFGRSTIAVDTATGREVWRSTGEPGYTDRASTMLFQERTDTGRPARLKLVRVADGTTVWSRALTGKDDPAGSWTVVERDGRPREIVVLGENNEITFLAYADGSVTRTQRIPGTVSRFEMVGDYLLVADTEAAQTHSYDPNLTFRETTTVYRANDLKRLWQADTSDGGFADCGPMLCTGDRKGFSARDAETGRILWTYPGMRTGRPAGSGRLLLFNLDDNQRNVLVDAATGRPVSAPLPGLSTWNSLLSLRDTMLVLRRTTQPVGLESITRLDLTTGRQTLLGVMPIVIEPTCWELPGLLACQRQDRLEVRAVGAVTGGG
jgi:outer membrane protein assembly factor BamB